jgi:hypothetical protein
VASAKVVGAKADAIRVFPKVTKASVGIGGLHGDGALLKGDKTVAYCSTTGGLLPPVDAAPNSSRANLAFQARKRPEPMRGT